MLYHGPVRVPADAMPGKTTFEVRLSPESKLKSLPTAIEVKLVEETKR